MTNEIVFDLETKKSFQEVGGRNHHHLLGVSVVGAYEYKNNRWHTFEEEGLGEFERLLWGADRIVGFNIADFDLPVLAPYMRTPLTELSILDMMHAVERALGFRVSLQNLASTTLGKGKSASGLDALRWWKEGKIDLIKEYCLRDVEVTRDLYEFGKKYGYIYCQTRESDRVAIPVAWQPSARETKIPYVQQGIF